MRYALRSHRELIDRWPSLRTFAEDVGAAYGTAKAMRRRGSVPVGLWPLVISAAQRRKIKGVTYESLTLSHVKSARAAPPSSQAEAS